MNRIRAAWAVASIGSALALVVIVTAIIVSATKSTDTADIAAEIRASQVTNTHTLDNTDQVLSLLLDCTDPEGACYQRGQDSQRAAIDDITVIAASAAACANRPENTTVRSVLDCTLRELDAAAAE